MAKKRTTRRRVNEPIVDAALNHIYDKIDSLQTSTNKITDTIEEGTVIYDKKWFHDSCWQSITRGEKHAS